MNEKELLEAAKKSKLNLQVFVDFIEAPLRKRIEELEAEVHRLNKWADGFSDAQLKERQTAELYQRELRTELDVRWRPIETAPKDGTHILLANKAHVADGLWRRTCWAWPYLHNDPTHWMPLPAAPKPTEEQNK